MTIVEEVRPIHLELDGEYCFSKPISGLHMCISNRAPITDKKEQSKMLYYFVCPLDDGIVE